MWLRSSADQHTLRNGSVLISAGLEDPLLGECAELTFVVPPGQLAEQAGVLKYGIRLTNIHGTLAVERTKLNDWEPESQNVLLKDATFRIVPPAKKQSSRTRPAPST